MNIIYANPVGIKKDIYIIKNNINERVYIGQAINTQERFNGHCKKSQDNCLVDKAINKYGKEHFWYEILETQIENYNEMEKYYIKLYNSLAPHGYNILSGGDEPPLYKGDAHASTKLKDVDCEKLKKDLELTDIPLSSLAEKYGISKKQVLRINQGISRVELNRSYPIRKIPNINGKLTELDVSLIIDLLQETYFNYTEIGKRFDVSPNVISQINAGISHKKENIIYPIRDWKGGKKTSLTFEQVTEIIQCLRENKFSLRKLAEFYGVKVDEIKRINNGTNKKFRRKNIQYPIRPF